MPLPSKKSGENESEFISRCMSDSKMLKEYPDKKQRFAVCNNQSKSLLEKMCDCYYEDSYGFTEDLNDDNFYEPSDDEYVDFYENAKYTYKNPKTGELHYYERQGIYKKDGTVLVLVKGSEYKGKKVKLNKPFRTPKGPKKFAVYTKNDKGNVVIVRFGDPNMSIKRDDPERRKNFRSRHGCDNPGPKWKAKYWSCLFWSKKSVTNLL